MGPRLKAYGILLLLIAVGAGAYYWTNSDPAPDAAQAETKDGKKAAKKEGADEAIPVELAKAASGSISSYLSSTSNLRARRDIEVMSRVEGVVQELLVEEGDFVRKDQTLCVLDDTDLQITLTLTKQQLAQARIQLEQAKIEQQKWLTQIENTKAELARQETALKEQTRQRTRCRSASLPTGRADAR